MARSMARAQAWLVLVALSACGGIAVLDGGAGGAGGAGGYQPCQGKSCGEPCDPCDPSDPGCVSPSVLHVCKEDGACTSSPATCPADECSDALPCPPIDGACLVCADGTVSCPSLACVSGQCLMDYVPNCPCSGVDAVGVGACKQVFGWAWGKLGCEMVAGCTCEGVDCDELFPDLDTCMAQVCNVK